ncbi:MAG: carbohydrate ABC transporter substrate-binding protein [Phycisphaeraceae bacterium]|nr:carbohydrate ABC transporter substrate-binding protein [Phycisphaeraceae bacterium]
MREQRDRLAGFLPEWLPPGAAIVGALAVLSTCVLLAGAARATPNEKSMWTFARPHYLMYEPRVEAWNKSGKTPFDLRLLSLPAMERRMMAAFLGDVPSADVLEVERRGVSRTFGGPVESVGFYDLTDRLEKEGLLEEINAPSFSPWTTRGRIFGLPHDVHPVMLGYRADLVEAAGIDVSKIETWEDFARVMKPLMADTDHDGKPDRYLLNMWETNQDHLEVLLLQAGGGFFDENEKPTLDSAINVHILATIVTWLAGPNRIAADAPNFTAAGNKLKADGYVVASFFPDWMGDIWKHEIPSLSGKMKLMPLPAWERGGRRTSVWGGTMLGIPKTAVKSPKDFETLWSFCKELYISDQFMRDLYREGGIVTPVKKYWTDPIFDEPNAYFSGQPAGRLYIDLAPAVPMRNSSPYNTFAMYRVVDALVQMTEEARATGRYDMQALEARARVFLGEAQRQVENVLKRNVFLESSEGGAS